MNSLFRIIRRYSVTAGIIIAIILISNAGAFCVVGYRVAKESGEQDYRRGTMDEIANGMLGKENGIRMSEKGIKRLEESDFLWGMALNGEGDVVWDYKLPAEIPRKYTLQEVSSFSRWYLEDYPVRSWTKGDLLFVFGCDPEQVSRHDMITSVSVFKSVPLFLKTMVFVNLAVIVLFVLIFGYRFYWSMRPIAQGIEQLGLEETVNLEEKGLAGELAGKLNLVSRILKQQSAELSKRDAARTEWIAGVSHDIRTPLSLIMGHSDKLSKDEGIGEENKRRAESIKTQSLIIRGLIADLNLTSKLAYQAQPLNRCTCMPAVLLRECTAEFYNGGMDGELSADEVEQKYTIELSIEKDAEQVKMEADKGLVMRALRNLLGNSIRHNPEGCRIRVRLYRREEEICWLVEDTGEGIPENIVQSIDRERSNVHIMGLRLTDKIARAHGGELAFIPRETGNYDAELKLGLK